MFANRIGLSSPALAASISVGAVLCANAIAVFERSGGLLGNAGDGMVSDLARLLCFYLTGVLVYGLGRTLWHVVWWIVALNLVDKGLMVARVAAIADPSVGLSTWKFVLGGTAIYAATLPLALAVAFAGYFTAMYFSRSADATAASAALAMAFLSFAISALLFPIAYAVGFYAIVLILEYPIFHFSLSHKSLDPAFLLFVALAALAVSSWFYLALSGKAMSSYPRVILGAMFLLGAVLVHIAR